MTNFRIILSIAALLALFACAPLPDAGSREAVELGKHRLSVALQGLDPGIDPEEARRLAVVAHEYPLHLATVYEITDPPFIHNTKVNRGIKKRGLCYHWAEDLEARLGLEGFRTIAIRRAISPARFGNPFEHSTVIATAPGAPLSRGIVLDPWRLGGQLFWVHTDADRRHHWRPRMEVLREKQARRLEE